jgi:ribosomal protein S18 acetylase RimI-like enzyme
MNTEIAVRPARHADASELAEMWWKMKVLDAAYDQPYYGLQDRDFCVSLRTKQFRDVVDIPGMQTFLAEIGDTIAGYVLCGVEDRLKVFAIEKRIGIGGVFVKPEYRRRGVGRALFDHVADFARQHGVKMIELSADTENDALSFYRAIGFSDRMHTMVRWVSQE